MSNVLKSKTSEAYEIYPIPHNVDYSEGVTSLEKEISVLYGDKIDNVTKEKVEKVLNENNVPFSLDTTEMSNDQVSLVIASVDSEGAIDQKAVKQFESDDMDFSKIDAYQLKIKNNAITVLGKDTDASFYGVVTLEAIIKQATDASVKNLSIKDYANTKIRGVIEGYYGIPWSNEDRISLMEFGGQFKATSFVFAPKDDPYHREKWGELYPEEMLNELGKLADVGNKTKNRFVWTISPLGEVAKLARTAGEEAVMALLPENAEKMLLKFDQLYDVGVRQFGVLGDDVGNLPLDYVVQLMAEVSKWVKEKDDVYDTLYCPASYNSAWAWIPSELNAYEKGFDENIQIFWTGSTTCGPVVQSTIDVYKNRENDGLIRRDPLFWLNWPVNDVDMSRVFLGKGEMLETNIENLAGVVTNPMQEAEASKVSIFAIADYAWNTVDFDDQKSWEESFKYIEPDATDELLVLSTHMSDAHPNGIRLSESEDIKVLLENVTEKINDDSALKEEAEAIISELEEIADAAEQFSVKTKNDKLKEELLPFNHSLRDMVLADIEFIKAKLATEESNNAKAWHTFSSGLSLREQSNNYDRPMIVGEKKPKPAQKRLQPFTDHLEEKIADKVAELLGIEAPVLEVKVFTNVEKYADLSFDEEIHVTSINAQEKLTLTANEYVGLKLSRVKDVTEIEVPTKDGLTVETSLNGMEWSEENNGAIRYIRLINHTEDAIDFKLDVFKVKSHEIQPKSVKDTNYKEIENPLGILDGDLTTPAFYTGNQTAGDYITYDLGQDIKIENLKVYVNESESDFPRHAVLEASTDNEDWTNVMTFGNQSEPNKGESADDEQIQAIFDQFVVPHRFKEVNDVNVSARFLRLRVTLDKIGPARWLRMQEVVINNGEYYPELNDPTITTDATIQAGYEAYHLNDGNLMTNFKPASSEAGSLLYHVGEVEHDINGITILEDPRNLSGSKVSVRTLKGWTVLGEVDSAYKEFDTTDVSDILDLKIEWAANKTPTIYAVKIDR